MEKDDDGGDLKNRRELHERTIKRYELLE